jgi:pimeloyl-ACP methyl ester carboxylesterase
VTAAAADRPDPVIVGQSYGAFTATLVADQLPARLLVLLAGMIPVPGESPGPWWTNTGHQRAAEEQATLATPPTSPEIVELGCPGIRRRCSFSRRPTRW